MSSKKDPYMVRAEAHARMLKAAATAEVARCEYLAADARWRYELRPNAGYERDVKLAEARLASAKAVMPS